MKGDIRFGGEKASPVKKTWGWGKSGARSGALVDVSREIRRRDKTVRTRKREIVVLLVLLVVAGLMYIARQPFTFYRDIFITGNKGVSQEVLLSKTREYLNSKALWMFPRASVFAFRADALKQKLHAQDVRIRDVVVNTNIFQHQLLIVITEYEPWAKWCGLVVESTPSALSGPVVSPVEPVEGNSVEGRTEQQAPLRPSLPAGRQGSAGQACGFIGDDGVLFALTHEEGNIPLITDERVGVRRVGERVLDDAWLKLVREWAREGALPSEYAIRTFTLKADGSMRARTNEGWDVIGDATTDAVSALVNLRTSLEQEIKGKRTSLEYVDVRFGKKVFYKTR